MCGRRLVAERLAAARGQDHDGVPPLQDRGDRLGLERQEAVVTPDAPDGLVEEFSLVDAGIIAKRWRRA